MDTYISPSTELMRSYVNEDSKLQRIVLVFKYILAEKCYNKNFNGGLGSYCLFIMITAYFK
jgi:DNA polymerase sigma